MLVFFFFFSNRGSSAGFELYNTDANSKKEIDFRHEFHTKISRKPSSDYRGLSINCFLVVFLFLIFVAFFVVNFQMLPSELCGQFVV